MESMNAKKVAYLHCVLLFREEPDGECIARQHIIHNEDEYHREDECEKTVHDELLDAVIIVDFPEKVPINVLGHGEVDVSHRHGINNQPEH